MTHHPEGAPTRAELPAWLEELERLYRSWTDNEVDASVIQVARAELECVLLLRAPVLLSLARKHYEHAERARLARIEVR